jgi:hypothetical protein
MQPPVATDAAQATPVAPTPRIETFPGAPPARAPKETTAPDAGMAQSRSSAERTSQHSAAGKPERAEADAARRAECGRIFQRLSLGESSPELLDRLKVLKCQ